MRIFIVRREMMAGKRVFHKRVTPKNPIRRVYINADISEIVIEPHDVDYIDVSGMVLGGSASDLSLDLREAEDTITLSISKKETSKIYYDVKTKVRIPNKPRLATLAVNVKVGDIRLDGFEADKIVISTANGDVICGGVKSNEAVLESINGDILIRGGEYDALNLKTTNGDALIELEVLRKSRCVIECINGEIRLNITEASNAVIEANTLNGRVLVYDTDKFKEVTLEEKFFRGILGSGDAELLIKNVNGDVRIEVLSKKGITG